MRRIIKPLIWKWLQYNFGNTSRFLFIIRPNIPVFGLKRSIGISPCPSRPNCLVTDLEDRSHIFSPLLKNYLALLFKPNGDSANAIYIYVQPDPLTFVPVVRALTPFERKSTGWSATADSVRLVLGSRVSFAGL